MAAPDSPFLTQWGFSEESTFGTPIADTGNFTTFEGLPPSVDYGLFQDKSIKYRNQVYADSNDAFSTETGGERVISFSDTNVRRIDLAPLLYSVTQTVVEAAGDPFQKDFDIDSSYAPPDFSANAGYFVTLGIKDTIASFHRKFTSCILRNLTLAADLTGRSDSRFKASGEWISGFASDTTANFNTGTWAFSAQNYYVVAAPTAKTVGGNNAIVSGWEVTFDNKAKRIGNDSSGDAENYALATEEFEITGTITLLYDANSQGFLADFIAGTNRAIVLQLGTDSAAGFMDLTFPTCQFTGNEQDYANPMGRTLVVPWKAMGNTTGSDLFNGEVEDGNDFGW